MPVPLDVSYTSNFDASQVPPTLPSYIDWVDNRVEKHGMRWAPGDQKEQILPYTGRIARGKMIRTATNPWWGPWYYAPGPFSSRHPFSGNRWSLSSPPDYGVAAVNKCYDRFKDVAVGETATWGTTIAEGREALGMIGDRAIRLRRAYKDLRRGDFRGFCKELSVKPKRKHKSVIRTAAGEASGLWLEYWFGWSPLAGEIYQSTVALTAAQVSGKHVARAWRGLDGSDGGSGTLVTEQGKYRVKTGATVRYDNMDLMLATQMGLTNPLAIAWELVPFSFVIDWFTGVGNVLNARSDFYGTSLLDAWWTEYLKTTSDWHTWNYDWGGDPVGSRYTARYQSYLQRRHLGLIRPVATYPKVANFGDSGTRAATAVSLLVQIFLDK